MTQNFLEKKDRLKKHLFSIISSQIDHISHVPEDLQKIVGGLKLELSQSSLKSNILPNSSIFINSEKEDTKSLLEDKINAHYDYDFYKTGASALIFSDTDFRNVGYWNNVNINSQNAACENLQDKLLSFIPKKTGRILDVACGMGASTRRLMQFYSPNNIWAINISEKQLNSTINNAPGCNVLKMNAVDMKFSNDFFDSILCIEAAFHFETRRRFLEESYRILKTNGYLVLSDILFTSPEPFDQYNIFPSSVNYINTVEQYRSLLRDVGFTNIIVNDVRDEVWGAHFQYATKLLHEKFYYGYINILELTEILWLYYHSNVITGPWVFVSAQKI